MGEVTKLAHSVSLFMDRMRRSSRDLRQRSIKRRGGAWQILEGKPAVGRLLLRFRRGGTNLGHRLGAIEQGFWCDHMKLMGFDRLILQQEDTQRDDVLAAPVRNIAVDRDRAVALHAAQ